jgi:hypothetical protein
MVRELKRLLAACGDREVWILDVLPRYLIVHCCDNQIHCVNVRRDGKSGTDACKKILTERSPGGPPHLRQRQDDRNR